MRTLLFLPLISLFSYTSSLYSQIKNDWPERIQMTGCEDIFFHGVASGDPLQDRVILWARVTPPQATDSIEVQWRIASDTGMTQIINSGTGFTNASRDYTFKADATGLQPNNYYFYDFFALGKHSVRGRTKTLPVGDIDSVRFAVVSCSRYEEGFFNAYSRITNRNDIDFVIHLGDYIYEEEYDGIDDRIAHVDEIFSLNDYRARYSMYKLDNDLKAAHQQYPFIVTWDDHEIANDAWKDGAENHNAGEGDYQQRKKDAAKAYFEWLPIREQDTLQNTMKVYRKFSLGNLMQLLMLDTRHEGRSEQVSATSQAVADTNRKMISNTQYYWLTDHLKNDGARWNILGQQVMMAPLKMFGNPLNKDQWDDYAAQRSQLYQYVMNNNIQNMVVLTGDIHTAWANDLPYYNYNSGTGAGSAGVEFVVNSVTSKGFPLGFAASAIKAANAHIKYADVTNHGYMIVDVNKNRVMSNFYFVNTIEESSTQETYEKSYYVNNGERFLRESSTPSLRLGAFPIKAPACPMPATTTGVLQATNNSVFLGVFPNPAEQFVTIQYYINTQQPTEINIIDNAGRTVLNKNSTNIQQGINNEIVDISMLAPGAYIVAITNGEETKTQLLIKK